MTNNDTCKYFVVSYSSLFYLFEALKFCISSKFILLHSEKDVCPLKKKSLVNTVLESNYAQHVNSLCRKISEFVGC